MNVSNHDAFCDIRAELANARSKFPNAEHTLAALVEEVGEAAQALLKLHYENGNHGHIYEECIQVAVMAIRLATEGDSTFSDYEPGRGYKYSKFRGLKS